MLIEKSYENTFYISNEASASNSPIEDLQAVKQSWKNAIKNTKIKTRKSNALI